MKQGETAESEKSEVLPTVDEVTGERWSTSNIWLITKTNISENVGVWSFRKSNKQMNIPWKLTGVLGCVRIAEWILTPLPLLSSPLRDLEDILTLSTHLSYSLLVPSSRISRVQNSHTPLYLEIQDPWGIPQGTGQYPESALVMRIRYLLFLLITSFSYSLDPFRIQFVTSGQFIFKFSSSRDYFIVSPSQSHRW